MMSQQIQGDGQRPYSKSFVAISQWHIVQLMQYLEGGSRHRLYDQSSKFRKFKFADGCHFENFWWNLVCRCEFWFRGWSLVMWQFFLQIQAGRWSHLENRFSAISRRCCVRLTQNLQGRSRISQIHRSHDQNSNFRKFQMADGCLSTLSALSMSLPANSAVHTFRVPIECSYRCLNFLVFYDCVDFAFSILAWIWALNSESY